MKVTFDRRANAAYIYLANAEMRGLETTVVDVPKGVKGLVTLDWKNGRLVGIEVIHATRCLPQDLLDAAERT